MKIKKYLRWRKSNYFETKDKKVKYSPEHGLNDIKFAFTYFEGNFYFMLHQKYIPIQE